MCEKIAQRPTHAETLTRYVAGFLFSPDKAWVALVRKNKPAWQAGKLNGIGGKIEPGETPAQAMCREFREEAGLDLSDWREFCTLKWGNHAIIHFFTSVIPNGERIHSNEDEYIDWYSVNTKHDVIPNLRWLIPLALDPDKLNAIVIDQSPRK